MNLRHVLHKGSRVPRCNLEPVADCGHLLDNAPFISCLSFLISPLPTEVSSSCIQNKLLALKSLSRDLILEGIQTWKLSWEAELQDGILEFDNSLVGSKDPDAGSKWAGEKPQIGVA